MKVLCDTARQSGAMLWTEDPRTAAVYDTECAGRWDHDFYLTLTAELGARSVVDIGCGTGVFAVDCARRGHRVIGVDPAAPMLAIACARDGGDAVEWIHGHATDVPSDVADLVIMMGHVAQYFIAEADWEHVLAEIHRMLVAGGRIAFETRNPAIDWSQRWTRERTEERYRHPGGGEFTAWVEMQEVGDSAESYITVHEGHTVLPDGTCVVCSETLRFRSPAEVITSLEHAGFAVEDTWGDWDRLPFEPASDELIVLATAG
jgi:SAM-dependent methyltransferase